jgi:hypothetical protein
MSSRGKSKNMLLYLACLMLLLCPTSFVRGAGQSSADYEIPKDVVSSGGVIGASSSDYTLSGTIGQPGTVGNQSSTDYDNQSGFWHAVLIPPPLPALSAGAVVLLLIILTILFRRRRSMVTHRNTD